MRSYGQFCAVARALDAVGDRWAMLIVRELLLRGSCRCTDLRNALGTWGAELMAAPQGADAFRSHWLAFPISRLADRAPGDPPITI